MTSLEKQILKLNQKYIEMFISEIMNSKNGGNDITEDTLKDMWKNISSSSGKQPKKKGTRKSGYTVFLVEQRPTIASENPNLKSTEVISIVAKKWRELPDDQKAIYINKAKNPEPAEEGDTGAEEGDDNILTLEFENMTIKDLRSTADKYNIFSAGKKKDLIDRLNKYKNGIENKN